MISSLMLKWGRAETWQRRLTPVPGIDFTSYENGRNLLGKLFVYTFWSATGLPQLEHRPRFDGPGEEAVADQGPSLHRFVLSVTLDWNKIDIKLKSVPQE